MPQSMFSKSDDNTVCTHGLFCMDALPELNSYASPNISGTVKSLLFSLQTGSRHTLQQLKLANKQPYPNTVDGTWPANWTG